MISTSCADRPSPQKRNEAPHRDGDILVSLIVSTRNRGSVLGPFLASLDEISTNHPWELVIVDNASTDETWAVLSQFAEQTALNVKLLREPGHSSAHTGRRAGSYAKNAAIRAARGEILCFTDDDCYPRPDFIDAVVQVFAENDVGFIGGQVLLFDPEDAHVCTTSRTADARFAPGGLITTGEIQGACMAVRREVLAQIGLFDTAFGAGASLKGAEDCDLIDRASLAGWSGGFFLAPAVYHHHRRRGEGAAKITASYDYSRGALYSKLLIKNRGRRRDILKAWYWDTFSRCWSSSRGLVKTWREMCGAGHYALSYARSTEARLT
jgi:GT2 family glycosyltransferase